MSMENVYNPRKLDYVSPPIVLKQFLEDAHASENALYSFFFNTSRTEIVDSNYVQEAFKSFAERRGLAEPVGGVINEVDASMAKISHEFPVVDYDPAYPPLNSKLASHRVLDEIRKRTDSSKGKQGHVVRGRYYKHREVDLERSREPQRSVADKDIVLTAHLMRPATIFTHNNQQNSDFRTQCETKFVVRGEMPLRKLREKIFCQADFWSNLEDTENATNQDDYFMNRFPSSFMFIYDTFYVDEPVKGATDISQQIREFMTRKKCFTEFHVVSLSDVKILDLKLRLGQPYIFMHQGHCEHLLIFTDLRLLNVNDVPSLGDYPLRIYDTISTTQCCACKDEAATYVVTESDRMPQNPAFMCEMCFKIFHYDRNTRIGNFRAYHYIDRGGLD